MALISGADVSMPAFEPQEDILGRLPKVDLIILEGEKMSVRPSVHKKFLRFE